MLRKSGTKKVLQILQNEYGNVSTALKYKNKFQLLVSTILSAQTTDKQVNKITGKLYSKYPDAHSFLNLNTQQLEAKIKSVGLYRNKARNIIATARKLVKDYNGEVPASMEALVKLPGVGRKTANVVLSVGFNHDAFAVDTHVFRVSNRIGLAEASTAEKTEQQLMVNVPKEFWSSAHHWLIWHGRKICKAQHPNCEICSIHTFCRYYSAHGQMASSPT
jgi:endonuclease-3